MADQEEVERLKRENYRLKKEVESLRYRLHVIACATHDRVPTPEAPDPSPCQPIYLVAAHGNDTPLGRSYAAVYLPPFDEAALDKKPGQDHGDDE